jgi:hypothetical protein
MNRRVLPLVAGLVVLVAGCIPVTEPIGDIDKAEPDKSLVGLWQSEESKNNRMIVDFPSVKGNPKGLMRIRVGTQPEDATDKDTLWFFTAKLGKRTYANVLLDEGSAHMTFAQFGSEGEYAAWSKKENRGYGITPYSLEGDKVTVWYADNHSGDKPLDTLMKKHGFTLMGEVYKTPQGWVAKELQKDGFKDVLKILDTYHRIKK